MSQSSLKILILGGDAKIGELATTHLRAQGVDADSLAISDSRESDAEIARILGSKNWDGLIVGQGVQADQDWFARVMKLVNTTKPNLPLIQLKDRNDLPNAIERHFNVKFPLKKA